ncbi:MAG TPA: cytochrome c maturation protein CcmE, partial [Pyrinomonadaceae bacterium]|nr:cytochrome c maturation protein CcmE [Pyrinomonadaceae bacterium]
AAKFRLGGMVAAGSFKRPSGSMQAHFRVTDGDAELPVRSVQPVRGKLTWFLDRASASDLADVNI